MLNSLVVKSILDKKIESGCGSDDYMTKENPTGTGSLSMNRHPTANIGANSTAEGFKCEASGASSHAEGDSTTASGQASHAEGKSTKASGYYSHAEGVNTKASNYYSHAEGFKCEASGYYSHAEGSYTTASASSSHAEGTSCSATAQASHAEGDAATASGESSHAEGSYTTASGEASHAEGFKTKASGPNSHAEGVHTEASGYYSHAEGLQTKASGSYSHSGGNSTIAGYRSQTAIGEYNDNKKEDIFEVGNGTSNTSRSNALELTKTGDLKIGGNYIDGSGNVLSLDSANEYTDQKIADLINGAPTTLDTLKEIADAMEKNQDVVKTLDEAIGSKANASDLTDHTGDTNNPHNVTKEQLGLGDVVKSEVATDFSEAETPKFQQTINDVLDGVNELKGDIVDLNNLFDWSSDKTNILNNITPTVGEYLDYNNGGVGHVSIYEWYELSVNEGQTFKYNGNNAHVAFFSEKYTGMSTEYYLSGLLTQENQAFTVPKNAVSMTLSVLIDYNNWLGKGDDEYRENTTIKKECLPKDKQIIVGGADGTYTNIVKAVKECEENTKIIVRSGVYDLEAQFKEVYGNDFFVNYNGYIADSNFELSGLYLKRGVKLIADSGTVLSFMYNGNNSKVSEEFSPISMTVDNIVDGLIIEVNSNVRCHVHDDFAFMAFMNTNNYGQNEIRNCVFKGNSTAGSVIGGGMGTYCKYIIHDNYFENTIGNAISYHNASFSNAQNFIDIFNNYAETPIKLWWYGDSTKITTALVHNNTASLIECTAIPNYDAPNENIKMKAWNNSIV